MNRKNSRSQKKLAILPIVLVAMLITTGTAYAFWVDTLTITGDVTTANFDVKFSKPTDPCYWGDDETKDIVTITSDNLVINTDDDWNSATITITGAYPGYHGWVGIGIECEGKVPVHLKTDPVITYDPDGGELNVWMTEYCGVNPAFPDCWQLHITEEYFFRIHFEVIEDDEAGILPEQGQTYTFTITFPLIQYNYNPCPED